jgi:hypothetical protein
MLLAILSAFGVVGGVVATSVAGRFPSHQIQLERWGGRLVVLGLGLAGLAFPLI